jgi:hypothetical protein
MKDGDKWTTEASTEYCLGKSFARNSKPYKNKFAFFASFEKVVSLQPSYKKL